MNPLKNTSPNQVLGTLRIHGSSLTQFARSNGFNPGTAKQVLYRYGGKQAVPRGKLTKEILKRIAREMAQPTNN